MEKEVSEKNQVKHEEEIDNIEDNSTKDKEIIEDEIPLIFSGILLSPAL